MRKCVNKKLTALFLTAVMGGSLCADMTVFAEETTDQEVIISETQGEENTASEEENQVEAETESDESEKPLEELPETTPNEAVGNVQVENENNGLEEKPIAAQSNGISLQSIEGMCGESLTWSFDETTGTLTISGRGSMYDYYGDDIPWSEQCGQISKVVLEDGITNISACSFARCNNLKEIDIPDSVTEIGEYAFRGCSALQSITLPEGLQGIEYGIFEDCTSLQSITLPDSVTQIDSAFEGCSSMKSITIPQGVEILDSSIFRGPENLESILVDDKNPNYASRDGVLYNKDQTILIRYPMSKKTEQFNVPDSVTEIGDGAFEGCSSLKSITIPQGLEILNSSEDDLSVVFGWVENLESIIVDDRNSNYSSQDGVLYNKDKTILIRCPEGKKTGRFNIPNGVKEVGWGAFSGCSSLQDIGIPSSVVGIDADAFEDCINLKNVVLTEGLKMISTGAFHGCDKLLMITIPKSVEKIGEFAYGYRKPADDEEGEPWNPVFRYPKAKIKCYTNTAGHKYAKDNGIAYELLDGGNVDSKISVSSISISGISKKIAAGKKIKLTVKVSPSKATNKSVKWTSSNKKVATVNSKGVVTINKKAGGKSVTFTAAATDGSKKKATYKISVMKGVVKKVAISGNKSVKAGKTLKLKAKVTATKKANKKLKWTSSNKKYATVSSSGKVKTYKAGKKKKVKITAEATDGSGKKKTVTIKIK